MVLLVGLGTLAGIDAEATELAPQEDAADAREQYNEGRFDDAIAAATTVWHETGSEAAALVLARARLERFRVLEEPSDLDEARELLGAIDPSRLEPRQRVEWEIGVATSLYFGALFGPAAEVLDRLLRDPALAPADRDRLLDWWASALDRVGRQQRLDERTQIYSRMTLRLEEEMGRNPASAAGAYWLVAAARGTGDLERAWNLGIAAWVRALATRSRGETLLADVDRLMLQGVIPDLAAARTGRPPGEAVTVSAMAKLATEWEALKTTWGTTARQ